MSTEYTDIINLVKTPNQGSGLAAPITPQGKDLSTSVAATHYAQFGQGGYRTVKTHADLSNISEARLELGMMVNVINDSNVNNNGLWILDSIDANGDKTWKKLSIDDYKNLNINAFQNIGWNADNFPTNATNAKWPSVVSSKGWFLGKVQKTNNYSSTNREYYIWLTGTQQKSSIVYGGTIDSSLLVTPKNISKNHILTIYTGQSYINKFLVTGVGTGDDGKAITVEIIDLYNTIDPFTSTFNFSPYFKGVVLITGEASSDNTKANALTKIKTNDYNPINYITSKYIRNGIVELGYCNLSVGDSNSIGGFMNSAFGPDNITFDGYSTALGNQNTIMGYASSAIGQNNKVYGEKSIAAGAYNKVAAQFSLISGHNNIVKHSTITVNNEKSYSGFFVSGGYNTLDISDANNNLGFPSNALLGYKLISNYPGQIIVGRYNNNNQNNLLEVGYGTSSKRDNAFEITKTGLTKANKGLEITEGNLTISDGYLNMRVFAYNSAGNIEQTDNYGEVKLVSLDGEYTLNVVNVNTISKLAGNATVNDNIEMSVYKDGTNTGLKAKLQCIQLGEGDNAQYSLRIFA